MTTAYENLLQHLDEHDFRYFAMGDGQAIVADLQGKTGLYRLIAAVSGDDDLFQVLGIAPVRVPEGARPAIAEALTRANYGLKIGKFEMDFEDGEVRFQTAQILPEDRLDDMVIQRLIVTTVRMLDLYLPAVLSIIYGNELPKDAVELVEAELRNLAELEGEAGES